MDGALDNSKDARRFTSAILHNSERLTEMVTNLIDLSRIEYGDKQFNLEEIDLKNKINSVVEAMSNLAAEKILISNLSMLVMQWLKLIMEPWSRY